MDPPIVRLYKIAKRWLSHRFCLEVHKSVPSRTTIINEGAELFDYVMEYIKLKKEMVANLDLRDTEEYGRGHPYFK